MANYFAVPRVPDPGSADAKVRMRRFFDAVGDIIDSLIRAGEITQTDASTWLLNLGAALTSDGSLTITGGTPTNIVINVGHTNTWTIQQVFDVSSAVAAPNNALVISNSAVALAPKTGLVFQSLNASDSTSRNWIIATNNAAFGEMTFYPSTTAGGLTRANPVLRLGNAGGVGIGASPSAFPGLVISNTAMSGVTSESSVLNTTGALIALASGASITNWRHNLFSVPSFSGVAGAPTETITNAATVYIAGAPAALSNAAITNAWAFWIDAGSARFDGSIDLGGGAVGSATQVMHGGAAPAWGAVVLTTDVSGVLPIANGGTNISSYTLGDILYCSAANVLSKLATSATATRYLSNTGASNIPAWAQVDLTNGVTGVLPAANGGTGATAFTTGSVVFAGASGVYTQNNANFFWDNSNKRLGLGTNAPATRLHVKDTANDAVLKTETTDASGYTGFAIKNGSREYSFQIRPDIANAFGLRDETAGAARMWMTTGGDLTLQNALLIANGGTSATTDTAAFTNLAPSQGGHSGEFLTTDGSAASWAAVVIAIGSTVTSGTPGSVLYIDASGFLAQQNANFFWDDASNRLGINTVTPGFSLDVVGSINTPGTTGSTYYWTAAGSAPPTSAQVAPASAYGGGTNWMGDPDVWFLVNVAGTDYVVPGYLPTPPP